jgi:ABC-2 type transport system ATP-binding protein
MIIINKGQTIIEGKVDELLASEAMKVNYEFVDSSKVIELVVNSKWKDNFKVKEKEQYIFEMDKVDIPDLTNYFFENGVKVMSVIPTRSLEEYFLKITEGGK